MDEVTVQELGGVSTSVRINVEPGYVTGLPTPHVNIGRVGNEPCG